MASSSLSRKAPDKIQELRQSKIEVARAEKKVALGIKYLYDTCRAKFNYGNSEDYDPQGIVTVTITNADLKGVLVNDPEGRQHQLTDLFPNKLANGIELHFFHRNYIPYPPVLHLIKQKIVSLCNAMKNNNFASADIGALSEQLQSESKKEFEEMVQRIGKAPLDIQQTNLFNEAAKQLLQKYSDQTFEELYKRYQSAPQGSAATHMSRGDFGKKLLTTATHSRSDTKDILTFNTVTHKFSYNEAAKTTAHDRDIGSGCANLSVVFEGEYQTDNRPAAAAFTTRVTSSFVKHASPAPIDAIEKTKPDFDILIDTYKNIIDIITAQVRLRQLGRREEDRNKPMTIDWVYQLLTTNAADRDNQAKSYGYIIKAMHLITGNTFNINGIPVTVQASLMNAGVNSWAEWNLGFKAAEQQRENRNAYIQLTEALAAIEIDLSMFEGKEAEQQIVTMLFKALLPPTEKDERTQANLATNNNIVAGLISQYQQQKGDSSYLQSLASAIKISEQIMESKISSAEEIETQHKKHWAASIQKVQEASIKLQHFFILHKEQINDALLNPKTSEAAMKQMLGLMALFCKAHANALYYGSTDKSYRYPENAALFNAYLMSYERLTGMISSAGCKSAHDRLFVVTILNSILTGQPLVWLPLLPLTTLNSANFLLLLPQDNLKHCVHTNASGFNTANDTAGGMPKVTEKKYPILRGLQGTPSLNALGELGEDFAAHKQKAPAGKGAAASKPAAPTSSHPVRQYPNFKGLFSNSAAAASASSSAVGQQKKPLPPPYRAQNKPLLPPKLRGNATPAAPPPLPLKRNTK
jgi:hypothetical protein